MPVHNAGPYVGAAVESILAQSLADFEFVIIDDGSTDDSFQILSSYASRDCRIRLLSRSNRGCTATRNELVQLASGEYIAWLDADDIAKPNRLEVQLQYITQHPELVALGAYAEYIDSDGALIGKPVPLPLDHAEIDASHMRGCCAMTNPTAMIKKGALLAAGGFRDCHPAEDFDLWLRLAELGPLANLPETLTAYRLLGNSASHRSSQITWDMTRWAWEEACRRRNVKAEFLLPPPWVPQSTRQSMQAFECHCADLAVEAGESATAFKHCLRALRLNAASRSCWSIFFQLLVSKFHGVSR